MTSEVILHFMKNLHLHNVRIHKNFHQNQFINVLWRIFLNYRKDRWPFVSFNDLLGLIYWNKIIVNFQNKLSNFNFQNVSFWPGLSFGLKPLKFGQEYLPFWAINKDEEKKKLLISAYIEGWSQTLRWIETASWASEVFSRIKRK